ncbi:MAG: ATP-binding protein, partial [Chloroflexi bacterium]|nr:ATP-binding protein [Chloroflexota bacterium]
MAKADRVDQSRIEAWLQVVAAPPPPVAPFLDRQAELDVLRRSLAAKETPPGPLILMGQRGLGTTTLAAHWAAHWSGLTLWADLFTANGNPLPILSAWAQRLGQSASYAPGPAQRVQALRQILLARAETEPPLLVVLDEARAVWMEGIQVLCQALPDRATLLVTTSEPAVAAMLGVIPQPVAAWPTSIAMQFLASLSDGVLIDAFA